MWLLLDAVAAGADFPGAIEAVSSTAIEHPEWAMDEVMTQAEWLAR